MTDREDLEKLFDAALQESEAPSRFGAPEENIESPSVFQKAPEVFQKADDVSESPFKADISSSPFQAAPPESPATAEVVLDDIASKSLDEGLNAELEELLDKKIAKEKAKHRRDKLVMVVLLFCAAGGAGAWLYKNPDKIESLKKVASEMKMFSDPTAVADQYKDSLDKVGKHGDRIGDAANMLGSEVVEGEDQSMDKEMKELSGEEGGLSASEKQKKLKQQFDSLPKEK